MRLSQTPLQAGGRRGEGGRDAAPAARGRRARAASRSHALLRPLSCSDEDSLRTLSLCAHRPGLRKSLARSCKCSRDPVWPARSRAAPGRFPGRAPQGRGGPSVSQGPPSTLRSKRHQGPLHSKVKPPQWTASREPRKGLRAPRPGRTPRGPRTRQQLNGASLLRPQTTSAPCSRRRGAPGRHGLQAASRASPRAARPSCAEAAGAAGGARSHAGAGPQL